MFADSEDIQSNLIGILDLFDQVAKVLRRARRQVGVAVRRGEAVDSDLHGVLRVDGFLEFVTGLHGHARAPVVERRRIATFASAPASPAANTINVIVGVHRVAIPKRASSEKRPKPMSARPTALVE